MIYFPQLHQNTDPNIQLSRFVLGIGTPRNITAPALEFPAELLLWVARADTELFQIFPHIQITTQFLLQTIHLSFTLTNIGCNQS